MFFVPLGHYGSAPWRRRANSRSLLRSTSKLSSHNASTQTSWRRYSKTKVKIRRILESDRFPGLKNLNLIFSHLLLDDYFVNNIEKVDSVTLLRKDKIMTGISWSRKFQTAIDTWPCFSDVGASAADPVSLRISRHAHFPDLKYDLIFFSFSSPALKMRLL